MTIRERLNTPELLWISHRGANKECPENTMPAFARAVAMGADMIELDVRLTRDEELVIMHDAYVQRTTDGIGLVHELTLDDIRRFDAGSWFSEAFQGTRVATLDEVLKQWPNMLFNIELKTSPTNRASTLVDRVLKCIHRCGAQQRVVLSSFDHVALRETRHQDPQIALGSLYYGRLWPPFHLAEELQLSSIHADVENLDLSFVREAKARGYAILTWTVQNLEILQWALRNEVSGVIVDDLSLRDKISRQAAE